MKLEQIAKLSGVSRSTVSRVINNDPNVSSLTREKVMQVVKRVNYTPNAAARGLAAGRIWHLLDSQFVGVANNWNGNWGQYSNPEVDKLIQAIPTTTDPAQLKDMYTQLVKIYLTDVPSFTLMYRPQVFHAVNETVWTNFPHEGDGTTPPVPPMIMLSGWGVAGLYNVKLVAQK